jgi:hypothetical protein
LKVSNTHRTERILTHPPLQRDGGHGECLGCDNHWRIDWRSLIRCRGALEGELAGSGALLVVVVRVDGHHSEPIRGARAETNHLVSRPVFVNVFVDGPPSGFLPISVDLLVLHAEEDDGQTVVFRNMPFEHHRCVRELLHFGF